MQAIKRYHEEAEKNYHDFITVKHITELKADTETVWELVPGLMNKVRSLHSWFVPSIF